MQEEEMCCCHKHKERSEKEYRDLINRLNRIEGQIRGIKGMVEKDAYCPDILIQIKTCVTDDIRAGKEETVDELVKVLQKLMK